jgi:hypothetical protein
MERRLALLSSVGHRTRATLGFLARGKLLLFLLPLAFAVVWGLLWAILAVLVAAALCYMSLRPRPLPRGVR